MLFFLSLGVNFAEKIHKTLSVWSDCFDAYGAAAAFFGAKIQRRTQILFCPSTSPCKQKRFEYKVSKNRTTFISFPKGERLIRPLPASAYHSFKVEL